MRVLGLLLLLAGLNICISEAEEVDNSVLPFSSDGCSWFPEGPIWAQTLWHHCCTAHDLAYWQGGDYITRLIADEQLRECVTNQGEPVVAAAMLVGVRMGGSPFWPTEFRWGYGWREPRGYAPLTKDEVELIETQLRSQDLLPAIDVQ